MQADIVDLREFYQSRVGTLVQYLLGQRVGAVWSDAAYESVVGYGYATPFFQHLPTKGRVTQLALMPATQGVSCWPHESANAATLVDGDHLPLADQSVDRLLVAHALEGVADPRLLLREFWRIMKSGGRLLCIVPHRRGLWAYSDQTPFGHGQPYSTGQLRRVLHANGFVVDRMETLLLAPLLLARLSPSLAIAIENLRQRLSLNAGGLLLVEASKQLYAPIATKSAWNHRAILPIPLGDSGIAPARRVPLHHQ